MSTYKNLMTVCAAVVLAFGLAACGSSSDDDSADATPPVVTPDPMPPAPTPVAIEVADFDYLDEDNMPMAMMHEVAAGETATNGGVTYLCAEGGDDCMVTVAEDGSATSTGGTVTASLTAAGMMQVADAKEMTADDEAAMALAARDRIIGKDRALEGASNLAQLPTAAAAGDGTLHESEISITRGPGAAARVRATDPAGYVPSTETLLDNGADWAGTRLMRAVAGGTQHLIVYTDKAEPTRVPFYNFDGDSTTSRLYPDSAIDTSGGATGLDTLMAPATTATAIPPLALGTTAGGALSRATLDAEKFEDPGEAADGNIIQRFPASATTMMVSFRGNYNGAPGTYSCTPSGGTTACVVTIPPTGPYTSTGTWTFTPELNATAWRQDSEFMSFGWWMQEPLSPNGGYTFRYYADGTSYTTTAAGTPTGTATYMGRAAGKYVVQTIDDSGVTGGMADQFTAAATLTANFSAAPNPTIEGTINGFQGEGMTMPGWEVTLHRKSLVPNGSPGIGLPFPASTQPDPSLARYDGVTATMGENTAQGDWTGQFFGNAMALDAAGMRNPVMNAQPLGVGGTFQADSEGVSIAGAYGARR